MKGRGGSLLFVNKKKQKNFVRFGGAKGLEAGWAAWILRFTQDDAWWEVEMVECQSAFHPT